MSTSIINNLLLTSNLPLDARTIVNIPTDVSKYWYEGFIGFGKDLNAPFYIDNSLNANYFDSKDSSLLSSLEASVNYLYLIHSDSKEPNGFINKGSDSSIRVDNSSGLFHLTPTDSSISIYQKGFRKSIMDSSVFIGVEGFHYITLDSFGKVQSSQIFDDETIIDKIFVSVIYWDASNGKNIFISDQRHGISMSDDTYHWVLDSFGITYKSGGLFYDFAFDDISTGSTDSEAQFSIEIYMLIMAI